MRGTARFGVHCFPEKRQFRHRERSFGKDQHFPGQCLAEKRRGNLFDGTRLELVGSPPGVNGRRALFRVAGLILPPRTLFRSNTNFLPQW